MIGSRHADEKALEFTRAIGQRCGLEDIQVISGGAKGVDQEAMLAALAQGVKVVGILADNLGRATISAPGTILPPGMETPFNHHENPSCGRPPTLGQAALKWEKIAVALG